MIVRRCSISDISTPPSFSLVKLVCLAAVRLPHLFLFGGVFTGRALAVIGTILDKNIISDTNKLTSTTVHWYFTYQTQSGPLSLVEECPVLALIGRKVHSVTRLALLCHKEPARLIQ